MTTHKPTFMEKLLGRNYKWWYLFTYSIKSDTAYLWSDFIWMLGKIFSVILVILVWVLAEADQTSEVVNYLVVGNIIFGVTVVMMAWPINWDILRGRITAKLLVPSNPIFRYLIESIFPTVRSGLLSILALLPMIFWLSDYIFLNERILWLLPFLLTAFLTRFFIELIVGLGAFWFKDAYGVIDTSMALQPFFAGSLIPFNLLTNYFDDQWWILILQLNPMAFAFYHPMQIYLGNYDTTQILLTFAGGIGWCVALWILAKVVFKAGLKKNESVGL